ncbi:MAG: DNA-directed DNA polymerase II small subunit [Methanoregulaceae archaeon]
MQTAGEVVQQFLGAGYQVHPEVVSYILEQDDPALFGRILSAVPDGTIVVSTKHIPGIGSVRDGVRFLPDPVLEVVKGQAGTSGPITGTEDYIHYFRDRYNRLGNLIRGRCGAIPIEGLSRNYRYRQEEVAIVGMVMEVKTTTNGHRIAEIEDPTGSISVLARKGGTSFADAERLIPDEVIGAKGKLSNDGKLFFAEQILRPDIPFSNSPFRSETPGKAVLISDVHVGSNTFLEEQWHRFAEWLDTSDAQYLLVAGDLVDGIGIYPGQDLELTIQNIYQQYDRAGELFSDLPSHVKIIISPGNHDVVRGAEPQPAIPEQFTRKFPKNCTFVENPALVSLQGVRVLMYHGRSIDDMIGLIPGASYAKAGQMMEEMLQRRHLAPMYGGRAMIAASRTDNLIIEPVPEILHTGHVHITAVTPYRGVLGVNAGTWQSQTAFQKQMNVNPTPAQAVMVDLETLNYRILDFN